MASWLVRMSPDQAVCWVRALARDIALCSVLLIEKYLLSLHATETGISSGLMNHLARTCTQTFFFSGFSITDRNDEIFFIDFSSLIRRLLSIGNQT